MNWWIKLFWVAIVKELYFHIDNTIEVNDES